MTEMSNLRNLQERDRLRINGREYTVLGRVGYVTKSRDGYYEKVFMTDEAVLILSDSGVEFGFDKGEITEFNDFGESAQYDNKTYRLDEEDYQIVKAVLSGNPRELEGECKFWNYVADDGSVVSTAVISSDGRRADVVSQGIDVNEIEML